MQQAAMLAVLALTDTRALSQPTPRARAPRRRRLPNPWRSLARNAKGPENAVAPHAPGLSPEPASSTR